MGRLVLDRPLPRALIIVPLLGTLILAAMLLMLDKMLRLFDFVVNAGGPVSVVWRMLANLLPEYFALGIPIGLMLGDPARLPQARPVVGARRAARGRARLRAAAARALYVYAVVLMLAQLLRSSASSSLIRAIAIEELRFDLRSGALGASIKVGEFNRARQAA